MDDFCNYSVTVYAYVHACIGEETARIKPEVVFDEEDGKGIICDDVMDETKKAVCRIRAA